METIFERYKNKEFLLKVVHSLIMIFIMIFFDRIVPPFAEITPLGMHILGIFFGILYGWIFVDLIVPSLIGYVALGLTPLMTVEQSFSIGFGHPSTIVIILTSIFAELINHLKVTNYLTNLILSRKLFHGRPWLLVAGLMVAAFVVGAAGSFIAGVFIIWAVVYQIADKAGLDRSDRLVSSILTIIVYAALLGSNSVPFQSGGLIYMGFFAEATGIKINFALFLLYSTIISIFLLIGIILAVKFIFRLDVSAFIIPEEVFKDMQKGLVIDREQKIGFMALIIFFGTLIIPYILPESIPGVIWLKTIGVMGVVSFLLGIVFFLKKEDGSPLVDIEKLFVVGTPWTLIILLSVTFPLAQSIQSEQSGIVQSINHFIAPKFEGLSLIAFIAVTCIVINLATQLLHNVVLGAVFFPLLTPMFIDMGGNAEVFFFMLYFTLNIAFVTPASSSPAGLVFGNRTIRKQDGYILGMIASVVCWIVLICIAYPIGNIIFK